MVFKHIKVWIQALLVRQASETSGANAGGSARRAVRMRVPEPAADPGGAGDAAGERRLDRHDAGWLRWQTLTAREAEALLWLERGLSYSRVAAEMGISRATARVHLRAAMRKLGVRGKVETLAWLAAHPGRPAPGPRR